MSPAIAPLLAGIAVLLFALLAYAIKISIALDRLVSGEHVERALHRADVGRLLNLIEEEIERRKEERENN